MDKTKKKINILLIIELVIILGLLILNIFQAFKLVGIKASVKEASGNYYEARKDVKNYKITQVIANKNNINVEYGIIANNKNNIIDIRVKVNGYTPEKLNSVYEEEKIYMYNKTKNNGVFEYNTSMHNGQNINSLVDNIKNDFGYDNVQIKKW